MDVNEIKVIVERVIKKPLTQEKGLLDQGILDSLLTLQLIDELEKNFSIQIEPEDFTHERFNSLLALTELVAKYRCA